MKIGGQFHTFITKSYPKGVSFFMFMTKEVEKESERLFKFETILNSTNVYSMTDS